RKEIADAAAYLRLIAQPRDEIALRRIINYPGRGIGRTTVMRLIEAAREWRITPSEALSRLGEIEALGRAPAEAAGHFHDMIEVSRASLAEVEASIASGRADGPTLADWTRDLFRDLKLEQAIRAENR